MKFDYDVLLAKMKEHYPVFKYGKVLSLTIVQEILEDRKCAEIFNGKQEVYAFLRVYCNSKEYIKSIEDHAYRYSLANKKAGEITEEAVKASKLRRHLNYIKKHFNRNDAFLIKKLSKMKHSRLVAMVLYAKRGKKVLYKLNASEIFELSEKLKAKKPSGMKTANLSRVKR